MTVQSDIQARLPRYSPSMRRVADRVLAEPELVLRSNLADLAAGCRVSEATCVRFCQSIGMRGFVELRVALAAELGWEGRRRSQLRQMERNGRYVIGGKSLEEIVSSVGMVETLSVEETIANLDMKALRLSVDAMQMADRIFTFGVGSSGSCAEDLQRRLLRLGMPAISLRDREESAVASAFMTKRDTVIIFSHTGETSDAVELLRLASARRARLIAVTNASSSSVAGLAHHVLETKVRETTLRGTGVGARSAQALVADCLYLGIAHKDLERAKRSLDQTDAILEALRGKQGRTL